MNNETNFRQKRFDAMMRKFDEGYYHRWYFEPSFYSEVVVFENDRVKHCINVSGLAERDLLKRV